jgi:hypothetical protein
MGQTTALTRTLNLLASIRHEDDPTIGELLAAVPDLQKMNWINRFGPARAWEIVASDIETDALDWLTKALVIAEREFDWIGGSVAAPIWLYQAYSTRVGADADALANWVLRNRGATSTYHLAEGLRPDRWKSGARKRKGDNRIANGCG